MAENRKQNSDRERIRNITNDVHPEYSSRKSETASGSGKSRKRSGNRNSSSVYRSDRERGRADASKSRETHQKKMKKIRRRRRSFGFLRFLAIIVVLVAVGATVYVLRSYNAGYKHYRDGITAYENEAYEQAIEEFTEAIAYDDKNADYYINLGMTYLRMKSYDLALGVFNQAMDTATDDVQRALLERGRGMARMYQGDYDAAISSFSEALSYTGLENDLRRDILYYRAQSEEKNGNYAAAADSYGLIIQIQDDATVRTLRGMAYVEAENYEAAETDLRTAIGMSRKSYAIYKALYQALMAQGKNEEAVAVLEEALDLVGSTGEDLYIRGLIYVILGDTEQATEALTRSHNKGYAPALLGLAEMAALQEAYPSARVYYENFFSEADLAALDTNQVAKAYNGYAVALIGSGDYESAVAACERGLSWGDKEVTQYLKYNLIVAYEGMCDWEHAYTQAKAYVTEYPDDEAGRRELAFLESRI